jgi:hypothetical protein
MEPEINQAIREKLEELGIDTKKVYGEYTLVGHLVGVFYEHRKEHYERMASMVNSHGFIGYLMGEYRLSSNN